MKIQNVTLRINLGGKAGLEVEKTCPLHEAYLMAAIHGEEKVIEEGAPFEVQSAATRTVSDETFDAKGAWEALLRKYGSATDEKGQQIVRLVFPNPRVLQEFVSRNEPAGKPATRQAA